MSGKQAIIDKIIGSAELTAEDSMKQADLRAEEIKAEAEAYAEKLRSAAEKEKAGISASALSRRTSVAVLEIKKIMLKAKREVLDKAYAQAVERLCNLERDEYASLIAALIEKFAEDGDEVLLNAKDENRVPSEFIAECGRKSGITLKAVYGGEPEGGVILRNSGCDKNLSVAALVEEAARDRELCLAELLFGGER